MSCSAAPLAVELAAMKKAAPTLKHVNCVLGV